MAEADGSVEIVVHQDFETKIKSPVLAHLVSHADPKIQAKKELLVASIRECQEQAKKYFVRYEELKTSDDNLDNLKDSLGYVAMGLILVGAVTLYPPLLYVGLGCNFGNIVFSGRSRTKNYKDRYNKDSLAAKQLNDLAREMTAVLAKNNLSSAQYMTYIEENNSRIALITDFAVPI
jgi:hypothetical protein